MSALRGDVMADTARYVPIGADYCTAHHGIREEDMSECDMSEPVGELCQLTPLLIRRSDVLIGLVGGDHA